MNLITEFAQRCPDSPWATAQQLIAANDGAIHLADKLELLPTIDSTDTTAATANGAQAYDLITLFTNFLKLDYNGGVHYYNGSDYTQLKMVSEGWMDARMGDWRNTAPGTPEVCWRKGKNLYVYPGASTVVTNGLKINYFAKPTAMTADGDDPFSDRTDLEDLHEGVVIYMMIRAKQAIGEWKQAEILKSDLAKFIQEKGWRVADDEMDNEVFWPYHKTTTRSAPIWGID